MSPPLETRSRSPRFADAHGDATRRAFLRQVAGFGSLAGWALGTTGAVGDEAAAPEALIVRNRTPLDLESPVSALDHWLTPNDLFFVRSHFGAPAVGLHPWAIEVDGMVDRPVRLALEDLRRREAASLFAVLQCSGNGRGFFRPRIPGVGWERGAVGHAEWAGVRLADLLKEAGVREGAGHVHLIGGDTPPSPKTPPFFRSIPLDRALDPGTLLATRMNGEPLPVLHGGPVRLVVPGWSGNHWIKWLRKITVAREEAPGFYQQTGYRLPKAPAPPGAVLKPSELVPVTALNVKSLVTWPSADARVRRGRIEVRGVAWTGPGHVVKVEFATDREPAWREATLLDPPRPGSWRRWRIAWDAVDPGRRTLRVRATDSNGATQPETTPWNKSGYLWNGIDHVTCEVV